MVVLIWVGKRSGRESGRGGVGIKNRKPFPEV